MWLFATSLPQRRTVSGPNAGSCIPCMCLVSDRSTGQDLSDQWIFSVEISTKNSILSEDSFLSFINLLLVLLANPFYKFLSLNLF